MKNRIQMSVFKGVLFLLVLIFPGCLGAFREESPKELTDAEKYALRKEIREALHKAEILEKNGDYVDAFVLMDEASQKAREIALSGEDYDRLVEQRVLLRNRFVSGDESPLMLVFKNRQLPIKNRQALLYAIQVMLYTRSLGKTETLVIQGREYAGTLVQIFTHPEISWGTKEFIVIVIEEDTLKNESGYLPDGYWRYNAEFLELWKHYQNELKKNYQD